LFSAWEEIAPRLRRAKRLALLLDFDGTLVNLQARPGQVRLRKPVRRALSRLVRDPRVFVVIISGRTLADIRRRVGVLGATYLGLFGWERESGRAAANTRARRRIERARMAVRIELRELPGIWIEDKGLSVGIHFRGASRAVAYQASRVVRRALRPFRRWLRVLPGKKSWDILPSMIRSKGAAVSALLARLPQSTLPIYAGDDVADESAFWALRRGITVHVGKSRHTRARFRLRNPEEVLRFLEKLEDQLLCGRQSHSTL
jgi:trehalose-phosphatase